MIRAVVVATFIGLSLHSAAAWQLTEMDGSIYRWSGGATYFTYVGPANGKVPPFPASIPEHDAVPTPPPLHRPDPLSLISEASRLLKTAAQQLDTRQIAGAVNVQTTIAEAQRLIAEAVRQR